MADKSLTPVIGKLENVFSTLVITVSPDTTKGAYGWCTS